jgi:hypothetical protein
MKLSPEQSLAGILEPVFAIRTENDLGIGDTDGVRQMIDWCHRHHLNIFQTLPINETSDDNSPYNAISSLAIEPSTLALTPKHLPDLSPKKFSEIAKPEMLQELHVGPVSYPQVKALKRKLLEAAFGAFAAIHRAHAAAADDAGDLPRADAARDEGLRGIARGRERGQHGFRIAFQQAIGRIRVQQRLHFGMQRRVAAGQFA